MFAIRNRLPTMKRAIHILFLFCLISLDLISQTDKGWDVPAAASSQMTSGQTYALIIGVSKYKNLPSQLKYADKDAQVFHQYLRATGVKEDHIHALINETALKGSIWAEVEYLLDIAKKGDVVYVYFSGHGDVERKTIGRKAYLLPYDSETHGYVSCAVGIPDLKDYFNTLSSHGVQLIFIGDACRVGNLVGGMEGISATASLLQEQWTDEIKILSCQPGQLSQESKQWGDGRGLFSFELINGLSGMADRNKNNEVTLRELELYLMEKVPEAADPNKQDPIVETTNKDFVISRLTPDIAALGSTQQTGLLASIDMKGSEELLLEHMSDSIRKLYVAFQSSMESGNFLQLKKVDEELEATLKAKNDPSKKKEVGYYEVVPSAYYYYRKMPVADSTNMLTSVMKRNLSAELLNNLRDFERVMNGDSISKDSRLAEKAYNVSLTEARELIRQLGVESVALRELIGDAKLKKLGFFSSRVMVETTGYFATGNTKAIINCAPLLDSAIRYTPDMPRLNWLRGKVAEYQLAASEDIATRTPAYYFQKELDLNSRNISVFDNLAGYYKSVEQIDSMIRVGKKLANVNQSSDPFLADFLRAYTFHLSDQKDSASHYLGKLNQQNFNYSDDEQDGKILFALSKMKAQNGDCAEAKVYYEMALSKGYADANAPVEQAYCFAEKEKKTDALIFIQKSLKEYDEVDHYRIGRAYSMISESGKALEQYEEAIKAKGRKFYSGLSAQKQQKFSSLKTAFEMLARVL